MRAVEFSSTIQERLIPIPKDISELKNGQKIKVIAIIETPAEDEAKKHIDAILCGIEEAKCGRGKKVRSIA